MNDAERALEQAVWDTVDGNATAQQVALLESRPHAWRATLERLLGEFDRHRANAAAELTGLEREQVLNDLDQEIQRLEAALAPWLPVEDQTVPVEVVVGDIQLQASWDNGHVVLWAAAAGRPPEDHDEIMKRVASMGASTLQWEDHAPISLPTGAEAATVAVPIRTALGWLAGLGAQRAEGAGQSLLWLARVTLLGVGLVARGSVVPTLRGDKRSDSKRMDLAVRWVPALLDGSEIDSLAAVMPNTVAAVTTSNARTIVTDVLGTVVDAIVTDAASRLEFPAAPPTTQTSAAVAEAVATRLDGTPFDAPVAAGAEVSNRLDRWAKSVTGSQRPRLLVRLDPPDSGGAWFLSVFGPGADGKLLPVEVALADSRATKPIAHELDRLERILPVLLRAGGLRRGQVYLSQDEAWELMTVTGSSLSTAGFEVSVPALSRRKPSAALRLFTEPAGETAVGAHQLSNVRWSAVFDDVELTAADLARLAAEARPLIRSRGQWVELDKADLKQAAAALAERGTKTQLTGAEILRHAVGLEGSPLDGGFSVEGSGWATELLAKARSASVEPVDTPSTFVGELRGYQREALGWLGFLDAVELGGCLALDMGLGKTPTVLAHLARVSHAADAAGHEKPGPTLVVAPPAVVGNWAAEAARFTPSLRVVVHHGASRASASELAADVAKADVVITTYATAVRDVEALTQQTWGRIVLDEAQAIKNPANETAQQLRRIPARSRIALTGTPIENGLGDLWAILDFTNPGLVGSRPQFIAQLSGEGEAALRALNGILVFRRTKSEPDVAADLPDKIDELDHCSMTAEQIGLYQAVLDKLVANTDNNGEGPKQGAILAAITALKQICNHPAAYHDDGRPLAGRSGKLNRLEEIVESVFAADERVLVFTHFAEWGKRLADHLTEHTGIKIECYHGGLARGARDRIVQEFQSGEGPGALVLSLKAGGTGLNLTSASHVVLYDRWWNPAVEDQARDRAWRIGQTKTVISHRLVCPGTVDERVEEVVAGKRHVADLVLPKSSSLADLDTEQLRRALGLRDDLVLTEEEEVVA